MGQTCDVTDDLFPTKPVLKCPRLWNVVMLIAPFPAAVHMALLATVKLFTPVGFAPAIIKENIARISHFQDGRVFSFPVRINGHAHCKF